MAISQQALAKELAISQMTVCRALRGDACVKPDLRRRVLAAAQKHGYPVAARARRHRNNLQHVVCSIVTTAAGSEFHHRLLAGIRKGIQEAGSQLMNFDDPPSEWLQAPVRTTDWPLVVSRRQVDGVVHLFGGDDMHRPRYACPVPHVSIFCPVEDTSDVATVDNIGGARAIGAHLGALGHRRVAYVGPITPLAKDRLMGLRDGLLAHDGTIPPELVAAKQHIGASDEAAVLLRTLLPPDASDPAAIRARFTAVAAYNDDMAVGVVAELIRLGLRVPEDISVTGFDGIRLPGYAGPALTTAAIPLEDLGVEAARLLYWRIDCPSAPRRTLSLDVKLVNGATAGNA